MVGTPSATIATPHDPRENPTTRNHSPEFESSVRIHLAEVPQVRRGPGANGRAQLNRAPPTCASAPAPRRPRTCLTASHRRPSVAATPREEPTRRKPGPQSYGSSFSSATPHRLHPTPRRSSGSPSCRKVTRRGVAIGSGCPLATRPAKPPSHRPEHLYHGESEGFLYPLRNPLLQPKAGGTT
jgi:hypothetical protein